ncbi:mucin-3A-like [Pelobates fuscus]|uniref:mucin-3A-like n=1 Tax=Pelobates fuscus TaxID=191477 RepID=UPI002FE436C7
MWSGSLFMDHDVIMIINIQPNITGVYEDIFSEVKGELMRSVPSQVSCNQSAFLCFNGTNIQTTKKSNISDNTDPCQLAAPNQTREFYFQYGNGTNYTCVTYCTTGVPGRLNCNYGECRVIAKSGPQCLCPDTNDFWYSGKSCDTRISRPGVIGGVTAALIVLILIAIIAFILCRRRRRRGKRNSLTKGRNSELLHPDNMESEWTVSEPNMISYGKSGAEGIGSGNFKLNLENMDTSTKIRINRPTININP